MPRKKNNRKAIQKAKQAKDPKSRRICTINHIDMGGRGLAMAIMASGIMRNQSRSPIDILRDELKEAPNE